MTEVAHESCDDKSSEPADICARTLRAIGLDGDRVVLVSAPLRTAAIPP